MRQLGVVHPVLTRTPSLRMGLIAKNHLLTVPLARRAPDGVTSRTLNPVIHMRIVRIEAYRVELPLHEGSYKWSGGNAVAVFDSTVVAVSTDEGIIGYGEVCPLGSAYLAAYANGARTGLAELAPDLLGLDPTELGNLNRLMDQLMRGHPYVKS